MQPSAPRGSEAPSQVPLQRVRVTDYYLAYVIPALTELPSDEDLARLIAVTVEFWDGYFEAFYADTEIQYVGIQLTPEETAFEAGIPEARFNYYINFNTTVLYELDSPVPPGPGETFDIMADAVFETYILQYVRAIPQPPANPFISNNEVVFRAQEILVPGEVPIDDAARQGPGAQQESSDPESGTEIPVASIAAAGSALLALTAIGAVLLRRRRNAKRVEFGKAMLEATVFEETVTDETSQGSSFKTFSYSRRAGPYPPGEEGDDES